MQHGQQRHPGAQAPLLPTAYSVHMHQMHSVLLVACFSRRWTPWCGGAKRTDILREVHEEVEMEVFISEDGGEGGRWGRGQARRLSARNARTRARGGEDDDAQQLTIAAMPMRNPPCCYITAGARCASVGAKGGRRGKCAADRANDTCCACGVGEARGHTACRRSRWTGRGCTSRRRTREGAWRGEHPAHRARRTWWRVDGPGGLEREIVRGSQGASVGRGEQAWVADMAPGGAQHRRRGSTATGPSQFRAGVVLGEAVVRIGWVISGRILESMQRCHRFFWGLERRGIAEEEELTWDHAQILYRAGSGADEVVFCGGGVVKIEKKKGVKYQEHEEWNITDVQGLPPTLKHDIY
ncbi:hypothetical protein DFH09DRAFT_1293117 [Mycena vulgaris]|nr:hypothetical protein DFH09DRAFT_1293117 [Mycena vulgaris]